MLHQLHLIRGCYPRQGGMVRCTLCSVKWRKMLCGIGISEDPFLYVIGLHVHPTSTSAEYPTRTPYRCVRCAGIRLVVSVPVIGSVATIRDYSIHLHITVNTPLVKGRLSHMPCCWLRRGPFASRCLLKISGLIYVGCMVGT
jgi:hypothetical protein